MLPPVAEERLKALIIMGWFSHSQSVLYGIHTHPVKHLKLDVLPELQITTFLRKERIETPFGRRAQSAIDYPVDFEQKISVLYNFKCLNHFYFQVS